MATTDVVTGAFSYTGSFIVRRLLAAGHQLRTLTNNPRPPTDLAGKEAGIRRLVHISIANPTASTHPYYASKARLEEAMRSTGMSYAIVRPTLVYGEGDVLINNIAWVLRHFPVFAIPGDGAYRLQPVHVEDVASIAVSAGLAEGNLAVDAAGPAILRFGELVRIIRQVVGSRRVVLKTAPAVALAGARVAGFFARHAVP